MAHFLKPQGSDQRGYDPGVNKQTIAVGETAAVALWGGGAAGERLAVAPNDPTVAEVVEKPGSAADQRDFEVTGRKVGHAMLEAHDSKGSVWAFMQIEVTGSPTQVIGPAVSATPAGPGMHRTTVTGALTTPAFPSAYPDRLTPDPRLQSALDRAVAAGRGPSWRTPVAIVALNPDGTRPVAQFRGSETHYSASLVKVAAMYAAFELRRTLRDIAAELGNRTTPSALLGQAAAHLDPQIMAKVGSIGALSGIAKLHALPRYGAAFEAVPLGGSAGCTVQFKHGFQKYLEQMISISVNYSAAQCIHASGYGYLNGVLASAGFFDSGTNNGIWLAGDYMGGKLYPAFRIPCVNDGTTAQAATALALARMFTLIHDLELVGGISSREMLDLLATTIPPGEVFSTRTQGIGFEATQAKVGLGPPPTDFYSEAAILEHVASQRKFVAVWQNAWPSEGYYEPAARVLDQTMNGYLTP